MKKKKYRGTDIIIKDVDAGPTTFVRSERERIDAKKLSRKSRERRRITIDALPNNTIKTSVYSVLLGILFVLSTFVEETKIHIAHTILSGFTSQGYRYLDEDDIVMLENTFNALHHPLQHLFFAFVDKIDIHNPRAELYMDIDYIVKVLENAVYERTQAMDAKDKKISISTLRYLKQLIRKTLRRKTD